MLSDELSVSKRQESGKISNIILHTMTNCSRIVGDAMILLSHVDFKQVERCVMCVLRVRFTLECLKMSY